MVHEVLTLQFGGFANYVGSHFWNIQDELLGLQQEQRGTAGDVGSEIMYREGVTVHGESTYTPRLILLDSQGSFGALQSQGYLYQQPTNIMLPADQLTSTWSGRHEVHRSHQVPKTAFQQELESELEGEYSTLEEQAARKETEPSPLDLAASSLDKPGAVRYFTDFLKVHLHPRSTCLLPGSWDQASTTAPDTGGVAGSWVEQGWSQSSEEAMERVRFFAEECDSIQGFQCLVQDSLSWGGLAGATLQELRDEYSGRPVTLFALNPPDSVTANEQSSLARSEKRSSIEHALVLSCLSQRCDIYVPLSLPTGHSSLPLLRWRRGDWFHESAIYAAAFDTVTLPYRLNPIPPSSSSSSSFNGAIGRVDMTSLTQLLTGPCSSPLAALRLSIPTPDLPIDFVAEGELSDQRLQHNENPPPAASTSTTHGFTAGGHQQSKDLLSSTASLTPGIANKRDPGQYSECTVLRGARQASAPADVSIASKELDASLLRENIRCVRHRVASAQPLSIPLPFPNIFAPTVERYGDADITAVALPSSSYAGPVVSCGVLTRLTGTKAFAPLVKAHQSTLAKAWRSSEGQSALQAWGWGKEEQEEHAEVLSELAQSYELDD